MSYLCDPELTGDYYPEGLSGKWAYKAKDYHRMGMKIVHQELMWDAWEDAAGSRWDTPECRHLVRFHACLEELTIVGKELHFPQMIPTAGWVGRYD